MTVLCLDTSDGASVAVLREGETLAAARSADPRRHVETLTPMIVACLDQAGLGVDEVTAIAVGTGPAPFTGLRVGLVTARTFALARGIDIYGVSSLDALADEALAASDAELLVVSDARRREVYWARYRREGDDVTAVAGPGVANAADVAAEHADLVGAERVIGKGTRLYPDAFGTGGVDAPIDPARLGLLALTRESRGTPQPTDALYLRRPDVHLGGRAHQSTP